MGLLAFLAYSDSFTGAFVFDDLQHVRDNPLIRDLGAMASWSGYQALPNRFVGNLTFAANYALGRLSVVDFHLVNFVIHAANAGLVYALVLLCFRTPRLRGSGLARSSQAVAFFAAALFATHPLQTQAVTYIVQRFTSLATLFYLLTVVLFLRWRLRGEGAEASRTERAMLYAAMLASAVAGMKTKEIAFTAPLAVMLCEASFFEPLAWRRRLFLAPLAATMLVIPLGVLSGVPLHVAAVAQATRVQTTVSRLDYLLTQAPVLMKYLRLLVWPTGQNLDHDFPVARGMLEPRVLGSILALVALGSVAVLLYRWTTPGRPRRALDPGARLVGFGIAWFFLALAVESTLIPIVDVIYEHRVYLPSVGIFCGAAVLMALVLQRVRPRDAIRTLVIVAVVLSAALGVATFRRNRVWASEISIWSDAAEKSPLKARPHLNLGTSLAVAGRLDEAARELRRAAELDPGSSYAHAQLGAALVALGRAVDAEAELREAVRLAPNDAEALFNLGVVLLRTGRDEAAKPVLKRFLEVAPTSYGEARRLAERWLR
ncbi:tetratricopeptide repeat protein [Anaeromyxobacter sp. SG17]|uniref:tetratricopeptide repeat protein n=1 Tax=Anaeromyxobacter sp. SG17 TaxID=2925405 RepID=UPI001F588D62|nr:tetratricopeptide repeat protein [Anaeromyxobacter sp. SG17]